MVTNCQNDETPAQGEKTKQEVPQGNFALLLVHLDRESLAAKLVTAYSGALSDGNVSEAMRQILSRRFSELKEQHNETKNQKN